MTKDKFFAELEDQLRKLPKIEQEEILADYEEHFEHGRLKGRTEHEIATGLGSPKKIARELMADYHIGQAKENQSYPSLFRAFYTSIGLGFFNLVFLLGPFIAMLALIFSGYVVSLAFVLTPFASIASFIWVESIAEGFLNLFVTFVLAGLGLLIGVAMKHVSQKFLGWMTRYVQSNLNVIKGESKHG
ncbi:DUF1700 domain-containing protein [Risungbinella massiliensis]|uniref:DUF1700 domain-containing protein n=1 Tax=Risungbinella massiliensis TaxID=1329796 RepID=UPI0005CC7A1D|nr:DUF1700 domain-containing protein [Risungbinella massiliensis]